MIIIRGQRVCGLSGDLPSLKKYLEARKEKRVKRAEAVLEEIMVIIF